jgi:hypothetical protein
MRFCGGPSGLGAANVWHLTIEDVIYAHSSIKQNVLAFVADLFDLLELHPVAAVRHLPGVARKKIIELPDPGTYLSDRPEHHSFECQAHSLITATVRARAIMRT